MALKAKVVGCCCWDHREPGWVALAFVAKPAPADRAFLGLVDFFSPQTALTLSFPRRSVDRHAHGSDRRQSQDVIDDDPRSW